MARVRRDFREARVAAGLSLRAVAAVLRVSHSQVRRFEIGGTDDPSIELAAACCAVVGLDLGIRAFPAGDPIRDRAHLALLERFRARLAPGLRWRAEVPLAIPGDLRAWDAETGADDWWVRVEAETSIRDVQALERRLRLKLRDGGEDGGHLVLLVSDTRANRAAVPLLREGLGDLLPLPARSILAALKVGRSPGGGGIVML